MADDRKDIIERIGEEEFRSCGQFEDLQDPVVPPFFVFLYQIFTELYREDMSWQEVESYCRIREQWQTLLFGLQNHCRWCLQS